MSCGHFVLAPKWTTASLRASSPGDPSQSLEMRQEETADWPDNGDRSRAESGKLYGIMINEKFQIFCSLHIHVQYILMVLIEFVI